MNSSQTSVSGLNLQGAAIVCPNAYAVLVNATLNSWLNRPSDRPSPTI